MPAYLNPYLPMAEIIEKSMHNKIIVFTILFLAIFQLRPVNCGAFTKDKVENFMDSRPYEEIAALVDNITAIIEQFNRSGFSPASSKTFKVILQQGIKNFREKNFNLALKQLSKAAEFPSYKLYGQFGINLRNYRFYFLCAEIYEYKSNARLMQRDYLKFLKYYLKGIPKPYDVYLNDDPYYQRIIQKFKAYNLKIPGSFRISRGNIDIAHTALKILVITSVILATAFLWWILSSIGAFPSLKHTPDRYFFEQLNAAENALNSFKKQYHNWIQGEPYEKINFLNSLIVSYKRKEIKRFIPKEDYKNFMHILDLMFKFNKGELKLEEQNDLQAAKLESIDKLVKKFEIIQRKFFR